MHELSALFSALGDPTRFAIVDRLLNEGELSAGDIAKAAPISQPAFSRHLKKLRDAGLVDQRIDRQRRLYSVRPEAVRRISTWTKSHGEFWDSSLDRLQVALEGEIDENG